MNKKPTLDDAQEIMNMADSIEAMFIANKIKVTDALFILEYVKNNAYVAMKKNGNENDYIKIMSAITEALKDDNERE